MNRIKKAAQRAQNEVRSEVIHMAKCNGRKLWATMHEAAVNAVDKKLALRLKHLVIKDEIRTYRKSAHYNTFVRG
jgi:hypothetical protein